MRQTPVTNTSQLRWQRSDVERPQLQLVDTTRHRVGKGEYRGLEFLEVEAGRLINTVPTQQYLPFGHTINAYRGCSHACTYCFARPTHHYLGLDIGDDFDSKIVVKVNAVALARHETSPARWAGELIAMGTNTDPYQAAEGRYRLTRGLIEVLTERRNPFSILTKSPLVLRDLDVLTAAAAVTDVSVDFSIGTLDTAVWNSTEPGTAHPQRRIDAVARLNDAGVPSGILMGPVLPGLSDDPAQIEDVVAAGVAAGAVSIGAVLLHLKPGIRDHYLQFLERNHPELVAIHRRRYGTRSYAARKDQQELSALVRSLVARHGGVRGRSRRIAPPSPVPPRTDSQIGFALDG